MRVRPGPSFENESPSARLFIRYDLLAPTATATPGTRCHEPVRCRRQRSLVPSVPAYPPRKFTATPEEALYLTANNRTIFHVTAFARLATSIRRVCPQLLRKVKGNRGCRQVIMAFAVNHECRRIARKDIGLVARH